MNYRDFIRDNNRVCHGHFTTNQRNKGHLGTMFSIEDKNENYYSQSNLYFCHGFHFNSS